MQNKENGKIHQLFLEYLETFSSQYFLGVMVHTVRQIMLRTKRIPQTFLFFAVIIN